LRHEQCQSGESSTPHIHRSAQASCDHTKSPRLIVAIDIALLLVIIVVRNITVLVANDQC
jgi:hypothetical protein